MRKIIIAILVLCTLVCCVGCSLKNADSATAIKKDLESYDWSAAGMSAAKAKAESLLSRIEKLSASEQMELKSIKLLLRAIAEKGENPTPSNNPSSDPSNNPTNNPSSNPSNNPSGNPSANPSGNPSPNPSNNPSANPTGNPSATPTDSGARNE